MNLVKPNMSAVENVGYFISFAIDCGADPTLAEIEFLDTIDIVRTREALEQVDQRLADETEYALAEDMAEGPDHLCKFVSPVVGDDVYFDQIFALATRVIREEPEFVEVFRGWVEEKRNVATL